MVIETLLISDVKPYEKNARTHPKRQIELLINNIKRFGFTTPILVDEHNNLIAGHGRLQALKEMGEVNVPTVRISDLTPAEVKALRLADNQVAALGEFDMDLVIDELKLLPADLFDLTGFDADLLEPEMYADGVKGSLAERFGVPPFSILDTKQEYWQERRRTWLALGIQSELGREENLLSDDGQMLSSINGGTSVFDPVLCELIYRWFMPQDSSILDPFAGGSVRGVVAGHLGYKYTGIELRPEQVKANEKQVKEIVPDNKPKYICGDSSEVKILDEYDMVFSCPPYADLEVYSDDPKDLSTMSYTEFKEVYGRIISRSVAALKDNRFACFVVGEVRDSKGNYYNFVGDTIKAFTDAGMHYYNEIILVNSIGTLPLRAGRQFQAGRKVGKCHQNVLVFYKGDPKKIKEIYGDIDLSTQL